MSSQSSQPLRSDLAGDPEMLDLIELYVNEMPERMANLQRLWREQELEELRRIAHQLKGASAGYGFAPVGEAAGKLERSLLDLGANSGESTNQTLRRAFEDLIHVCQRVSR